MHFSCHSSEDNLAQPWVYSGIWNATASFNKQQKQVWMLMFETVRLKWQGISFFLLGCCLDTQLSTQKIFLKPQEENKSGSSFFSQGWKNKIAREINFWNSVHLESCRQLHEDCRGVRGGDSVRLQILGTSQERSGCGCSWGPWATPSRVYLVTEMDLKYLLVIVLLFSPDFFK